MNSYYHNQLTFSYEILDGAQNAYNKLKNRISRLVNDEVEVKKEKFKMIEPLCLVHGTYIVGENEDGMYIMDQHAVNERINYEYYLKEMGKEI